MSAVRDWLEEIGLAQYADAFEANDIDTDLLTQIDDQLLKDIGVSSAGHRLRLRNAIAKLAPTSITEGISEVPTSPPPSDMFKAMEAAGRTMAPGAIAIPFMSTGGPFRIV